MYISARERRIIEILLSTEEGMTVKDLAHGIEVSSRTIHRDLNGVEQILTQNDLILKKKSGKGIQVIGDPEKKNELQLFLFNLSHNEYTPEERRTIVLSTLLEAIDPVKLVSLAYDLNVTVATISNDLNNVSEILESYGLSLIRKRGYGVEINGSETSKRRLMSNLILDSLDEFGFLSIIRESIQKKSTKNTNTITDKLLGLVDKKKVLIIEKQVNEIKEQLPYSIADSSYIGLVVHLSLAVERIYRGENITFDLKYLESMSGTKEYQITLKIVEGLERVLAIDIPREEIGYITMHLMGAKLRYDQDSLLEEKSIQMGIKVQNLIKYVGNELDQDLTNNIPLFQGLVTHLRPAIYRLRQNMGISNPLLSKIEQDYSKLFLIIKQATKAVFPDFSFPNEEIGYLVMHFASALLNSVQSNDFSALVICSSGIGTSRILAAKINQEIPEIKTAKNISMFELNKINLADFDIVISTVMLADFTGNYILVSPILSKTEVEKIRHILKQKRSRKKVIPKDNIRLKNDKYVKNKIGIIQKYSTVIFEILDGFNCRSLQEVVSIDQALYKASQTLHEKSVIADSEIVVKDLLERELSGGLGIPNTSLALYHARSLSIINPSFTVCRLENSLTTRAMDGSSIEINTILLLLSPLRVEDEVLEVLSYISSLIIRDEETIELFESKVGDDIYTFLSNNLDEFFGDKLAEIRSVEK